MDPAVLPAAVTRRTAIARLGAAAAVATVPGILTACGGGSRSAAGGGSIGTSATSAPDPASLQRGGRISFAAAQGIPQLDPYRVAFLWEYQSGPLMWGQITRFTQEGGVDPQPYMASEWRASSDLRTYTFKLRDDLTTSDGQRLTSAAIAGSLRRGLDPKLSYKSASYVGEVDRIKTPDDTTLVIVLKQGSIMLPAALAQFPIAGPGVGVKATKNVPTTGPFKIAEFVPNDHLTLVPNEHWWGEAPHLGEIDVVRAQDNTSAVTSLRSGQLSALWGAPYTDLAKLRDDPTVTIVTSELSNTSHYYVLDNTSSPFDDVAARRALSYAIDRDTIVKTAYAGFGEILTRNAPLSSRNPFFDDELPEYTYDPERARSMFAKAGVTDGLSLTYWTTGGQYPEWSVAGQIIQSDLEKFGLKVNIQQRETNTWASTIFPKGKRFPDLIAPNFGSGSGGVGSLEAISPTAYLGNWDAPAVTEALAKAAATSDAAKRKELYSSVQKEMNEQAPAAMLMMLDTPLVTVSELKGTWIDPAGFVHLENAGLAK